MIYLLAISMIGDLALLQFLKAISFIFVNHVDIILISGQVLIGLFFMNNFYYYFVFVKLY